MSWIWVLSALLGVGLQLAVGGYPRYILVTQSGLSLTAFSVALAADTRRPLTAAERVTACLWLIYQPLYLSPEVLYKLHASLGLAWANVWTALTVVLAAAFGAWALVLLRTWRPADRLSKWCVTVALVFAALYWGRAALVSYVVPRLSESFMTLGQMSLEGQFRVALLGAASLMLTGAWWRTRQVPRTRVG